jgi:hypothetical protein
MFPENGKKQPSISDSALALHVLHKLTSDTSAIDEWWLSSLPEQVPTATDADEQTEYLPQEDTGINWMPDSVRRLQLPWTIVATVDAYHTAGVGSRYRAQLFLGALWARLEELRREIADTRFEFAASELVIGLRYLVGDEVI